VVNPSPNANKATDKKYPDIRIARLLGRAWIAWRRRGAAIPTGWAY
jgi:hypothetical protein